jgi:hypothetical protein
MKIQELRIGNYILDEGEFATVELINGETEEIFYKGTKTYLSDNIQYIDPIIINEYNLKKIGFKVCFDNEFNTSYRYKEIEYNLPKHNLTIYKGFAFFKRMSFKIEYIHELQNLYFCLTGYELTVV